MGDRSNDGCSKGGAIHPRNVLGLLDAPAHLPADDNDNDNFAGISGGGGGGGGGGGPGDRRAG
jgi:hypothetical protein